MWKCPKCETINNNDICVICGEQRTDICLDEIGKHEHTGRFKQYKQKPNKHNDQYKKTKKIYYMVICILVIATLASLLYLNKTAVSPIDEQIVITDDVKKEIDLGYEQIGGEKYNDAIVTFNKVVECEENKASGYLGLAEAYIRSEDFTKAQEILKIGLEKTNNQNIADKLAGFKKKISDSEGRARKINQYDANGNLSGYSILSYQGDKNTETNYYNADGKLTLKSVNEYDKNGILRKYCDYDGNGTMTAYTIIHHDENGKETRHDKYDPDGTLWGYDLFEYDKNGDVSKTLCYSNGELTQYFINNDEGLKVYDANGNLIGETKKEK